MDNDGVSFNESTSDSLQDNILPIGEEITVNVNDTESPLQTDIVENIVAKPTGETSNNLY